MELAGKQKAYYWNGWMWGQGSTLNTDSCHYESVYPSHLVHFFWLAQHFSMARVIGLGVNRKAQSTGEPMPNFSVGLELVFGGVREGGVNKYFHDLFTVEKSSSTNQFPHLFLVFTIIFTWLKKMIWGTAKQKTCRLGVDILINIRMFDSIYLSNVSSGFYDKTVYWYTAQICMILDILQNGYGWIPDKIFQTLR